MIQRLPLLVILLLVLVSAGLSAGKEAVVLVTFEGVSLDQLLAWDLPEYRQLMATGAVGLLNNRTEGPQTFANNAVTVGAGLRAVGSMSSGTIQREANQAGYGAVKRIIAGEFARFGFNAGESIARESASLLYTRYTGHSVPPSAVVQINIAALQKLNSEGGAHVTPGLLGEQLHKHGVDVAVFGNSDEGSLPSRNGVAIAMNTAGWAPHGDVGRRTVIADPLRPFGIRTNYPYLLQRVAALPFPRQFVVVEAGDGGRLENARMLLSPQQFADVKRQTAKECGEFLLQLDASLRERTDRYVLILAVMTQDSDAAARKDLLTPVIFTGTGVTPGLLSCATTRRPGLITNIDLAPTVLRFFAITPPQEMQGSAVTTRPQAGASRHLQAMDRQMVATYNGRKPLVIGYITSIALIVLWAIIAIIWYGLPGAPGPRPARADILKPLLTALMLSPASLLLAGGVGIYDGLSSAVFLAVTAITAAYLLHRYVRDLRLLFAIVGFTVAGVYCLDLALGTPLLEKSLLSYDPIMGIRFYGLGNESSGVLLGATLLGIYALLDYLGRLRPWSIALIALMYVAVFILVGGPDFGSDFGGMVSALPGFGYALIYAQEPAKRRVLTIWVGVIAVVLFALLMAANLLLRQSHIGYAFSLAFADGPSVLVEYALRKWSMNFKLLRNSFWTFGLVSLVIGLTAFVNRPVGIGQRVLEKHPLLNAGFMGIMLCMVVAMLTNDSGVVMAATGMIYLTVPLMQMVLAEREAMRAATEAAQPSCQS